MGVSENRGTPKWMEFRMENPIKMDDLRVPPFSETPTCCSVKDTPKPYTRSLRYVFLGWNDVCFLLRGHESLFCISR